MSVKINLIQKAEHAGSIKSVPGFMQRLRQDIRLRFLFAGLAVAPIFGGCATPGEKVPSVQLTYEDRQMILAQVEQIKNEYLGADDKSDKDAKTAVSRLTNIFSSYNYGGIRDSVIAAVAAIYSAAKAAGDNARAQEAATFLGAQGYSVQQ